MGSLKYLLGLSAVRCHLPGALGLCLPVNKAFKKATYILTIVVEGETGRARTGAAARPTRSLPGPVRSNRIRMIVLGIAALLMLGAVACEESRTQSVADASSVDQG